MEIINLKNTVELNFEKIIRNKSICDDALAEIEDLNEKINNKYNFLQSTLLDNVNTEIPIYLGIDSLNFQNKLLTLKIFNLKTIYNRTFVRIYADYYKVHKLIRKYITTNTNIPSIDINFTPYKDLDLERKYSFEEICKLQNTINQYIQSLYDLISKKNITIQPFINSDKAGFAVNYYISEENTNIGIYTNKCLLFINYLTTFNTYHNNYLLDFLLQCRFVIACLKKDIDFNNDNDILNINDYIDNVSSTLNKSDPSLSFDISNSTLPEPLNLDISNSTLPKPLNLDISYNITQKTTRADYSPKNNMTFQITEISTPKILPENIKPSNHNTPTPKYNIMALFKYCTIL